MFGNMHALFSNAYEKNIDIFTIILPRGDFFQGLKKFITFQHTNSVIDGDLIFYVHSSRDILTPLF